MKKQDLHNHIRDYYLAQRPSPRFTHDLKTGIEKEAGRGRSGGRQRLRQIPRSVPVAALVACSAILTLSLAWWHGFLSGGRQPTPTLAQSIAAEVAMNHRKHLAPDYPGASIPELNRLMDKLDFKLQVTGRFADRALQLSGARYCSIQGQLAVQFQFRTPSGGWCTLYQTPASGRLTNIDGTQLTANGLRIHFWTENGLFMAFAETNT